MKKLYIIAFVLSFTNALYAQKLDRSKLPVAGPAPKIDYKDPSIFKLPNGITVLVVENHKLPKISATYSIDGGPKIEGEKAGVLRILGSMLNEGTESKSKLQFDEAVDQTGGQLNLNASGGSVSALTRYFDSTFMLMAEALRHPLFPESSFQKIKSQVITNLRSNAKNASDISGKVVSGLSYGTQHPLGEFATEQTINSLTVQDIKKAYLASITPSRGYLTFIGDISAAQAKSLAEKAFADWTGISLTLPKIDSVVGPGSTEINFVDVPNAVQSEITVTNLIELPLSSPDYYAVLLANQILGGGADAKLFRNLREKHGFTYGSYAKVGTGRFQSLFTATAAVRSQKVDSAIVEIISEINVMRNEKVTNEILQNAKNLYNGSFALGLESPGRTASLALSIMLNQLPKDFYKTYLQKINAVTIDDIQRVSRKYFLPEHSRIIIVGNAAAFSESIKRLGYPIKQFNTLAQPI